MTPPAQLTYDPVPDRMTVVIDALGTVDVCAPVEGLYALFDPAALGRMCGLHCVGALLLRPNAFRHAVRELAGPLLWASWERVERQAEPVTGLPVEVDEDPVAQASRLLMHYDLRRGSPMPGSPGDWQRSIVEQVREAMPSYCGRAAFAGVLGGTRPPAATLALPLEFAMAVGIAPNVELSTTPGEVQAYARRSTRARREPAGLKVEVLAPAEAVGDAYFLPDEDDSRMLVATVRLGGADEVELESLELRVVPMPR